MYAMNLIALYQTLFGHNLQELQDCRVTRGSLSIQFVMDFTDCRSTTLPKHAENFQLGIGGTDLRYLVTWIESKTNLFVGQRIFS